MKVDREKIWIYLLEKCEFQSGTYFDNLCYDFDISRTLAKKIVKEFIDENDRFIIQKKVKIIWNNHPREKTDEDILQEKLEEVIKKEKILIGLLEEELRLIDVQIEQNEILKTIPVCENCE